MPSGVGNFGESLASVLLEVPMQNGPLFRIEKIGGNWPTIDVYAEVEDNQKTYLALFQIKSTETPLTINKKLRISVSRSKLQALSNYQAPTYIIGVEYDSNNPPTSNAYIKGVYGQQTSGIGTIDTTHLLNNASLLALKDEIVNFWNGLRVSSYKGRFRTRF